METSDILVPIISLIISTVVTTTIGILIKRTRTLKGAATKPKSLHQQHKTKRARKLPRALWINNQI